MGQFLRRTLSFSRPFRGNSLRTMFRQSPEETALALFLYVVIVGAALQTER